MAVKQGAPAPSFLATAPVEHEVNGQTLRFHAISLKVAIELRSVAKPLAQAFTALFSGVGQESSAIERTYKRPGATPAEAEEGREAIVNAITPELAKLRLETREKAINDLIVAFTETANTRVLARIIMDSLRESYPRNPDGAVIDAFIADTDVGALAQLLVGLQKANKEAFRPLTKGLTVLRGGADGQPVAPSPANAPSQ